MKAELCEKKVLSHIDTSAKFRRNKNGATGSKTVYALQVGKTS